MKITVQNLIVDRDMVLKPHQQVWPWEVPVLQEKFGESKVRLMDTAETERNELPNPGEEFMRLAASHNVDSGKGGTNRPYVELAYGRGRSGIEELGKAIKRAAAKKRVTKAKAKPVEAKPKVEAKVPKAPKAEAKAEADPLGM